MLSTTQKKKRGISIIAAIATGLLTALSFPSWHVFPLVWIALIPLLTIAFRQPSPKQTFFYFFVSGAVFYLILLQWLLCNVYWAGGWAVWGYVALCALMAAYWGCCGATWHWLCLANSPSLSTLSLAVLWTTLEFLQGKLFTGFGWGALGYVHAGDIYVLQLASIGGTGLLSFLTVVVNNLLARALCESSLRLPRILFALGIVAVAHLVGWSLLDEADYRSNPFLVGLVQSNFPQEVKWDPEYGVEMVDKTIEVTREMLDTTGVDLIVWPEALIMTPLETPGVMKNLAALTREAQAPLFTGISRFVPESNGWANSSCLITEQGNIAGYYDKIHLAPFGEYVPLGKYFPFITQIVPAIGEMVPGESPAVFDVGTRRIGPLICFEVLFPEMAERLRRNKADCLVVITNLAWFGVSNAIPQEREISRLRAVETRLPLIHCANTGVSGVFDPYGRFTNIGETHIRTFDAVPVAAPTHQPLPVSPSLFSKICAIASAVFVILKLIIRIKSRPDPQNN